VATVAAVAAFVVPGSAGAAGTKTVWVPASTCAAPRSGHMGCLALRLVRKVVPAAATTPDAARVRPSVGNGPAGGYAPNEIAKAYGFNANAATRRTVAIVDAYHDPTVRTDLNKFDARYGLPAETATSFKQVNQSGNASPLPANDPTPQASWATETTLDVQAVRGLCHKCKILLVEAGSDGDASLAASVNAAVARGARIVSNSYGGPENDPNETSTVRAKYDHPGVAILAASGDDGWRGWDFWNCVSTTVCGTPLPKPDDFPTVPASYNSVIGVGGTSLYLNANGSRASETVWNDNGPGDIYGGNLGVNFGASGSGCSTRYGPRGWQAHVAGYGSLGCGASKRNGVDIAALADPFTGYDIYQSFGNKSCTSTPFFCWETLGGTSLAAPVIGAMWALAGGPAAVRYPSLSLYGHYQTGRPLYDVTVGGTGFCGTANPTSCTGGVNPNMNPALKPAAELDCAWDVGGTSNRVLANRAQCYARSGYDGVSGVGTPKGLRVFTAMNPRANIKPPGTVQHGVRHTFSAAGTTDPFPGGRITKYTWNWGDGHATTTTTVTATHTYANRHTRTIKLTVTDNYGRRGSRSSTISVT
jgi:subtilase family serine protease